MTKNTCIVIVELSIHACSMRNKSIFADMTVVKSTGSRFLSYEPLVEMNTEQSLCHITIRKRRMNKVFNQYPMVIKVGVNPEILKNRDRCNFLTLTVMVASHQLVHIKGWRRFSFFMFSKQFLFVSLRRDEMLTWLIFHLFGNLSDNN